MTATLIWKFCDSQCCVKRGWVESANTFTICYKDWGEVKVVSSGVTQFLDGPQGTANAYVLIRKSFSTAVIKVAGTNI